MEGVWYYFDDEPSGSVTTNFLSLCDYKLLKKDALLFLNVL
jgi:hypothetical protein